jgi:hypothetical protein
MISLEQKILSCSTELKPDVRQKERLRRLLSHNFDGDHLINLAIKEGMVGFLYKRKTSVSLLPDSRI